MNDENLRLTGTANNPLQTIATTATTLNGTGVLYGANRAGYAVLRCAGAVVGTTGSAAFTIQQATTLAGTYFDLAVVGAIIADGLATQTGADPTGAQMGIETSAFTAKAEIPGTVNAPAQLFITTMDYIRARIVTTGTTCSYTNVSLEIVPTQDVVKRSGVA